MTADWVVALETGAPDVVAVWRRHSRPVAAPRGAHSAVLADAPIALVAEHPRVDRSRCGESLLFAGVHDLMHLDRSHGLMARKETRP